MSESIPEDENELSVKKTCLGLDGFLLYEKSAKQSCSCGLISIFFIVALGLISQYSVYQLLRSVGVNEMLSIVRGGSTVLVLLFGYYVYKENLSILKILGIFLVLGGILLITNY